MINGKIKHPGFLIVICTILTAVGCFFAMEGTGTYKYEAMVGDSLGKSPAIVLLALEITEIMDYQGPLVDETLDDEFDLLDSGELDRWVWFDRIQVYVFRDGNGQDHYGTSQA